MKIHVTTLDLARAVLAAFLTLAPTGRAAQALAAPGQAIAEIASSSSSNLTRMVCPLAGSDAGHIVPGAVAPFGMVWLSPDVSGKQPPNGYSSKAPILGFSHTHVSGTGGNAGYGNVRVTPQRGALVLPGTAATKDDEIARAGYYAVTLKETAVRAELTASPRVGFHRYTFTAGGPARLLLDAACQLASDERDLTNGMAADSAVHVVSDRRIEGYGLFKGVVWGGGDYTVYFAAEFDQPFAHAGVWKNNTPLPDAKEATGQNTGAYAEFNPAAGSSVGLRVGISFKSAESASTALGADTRSFDEVLAATTAKWENVLSSIAIEGGTDDQRRLFTTCLYHTFTTPTDLTGDNPAWDSNEPHFWHFFTIWDTFRSLNPLLTLVAPDKQRDMLRCLLDIYDHKGWLPDAWITGNYGPIQGGNNASVLFTDAYVKGLPGIDYAKALRAMRKDAETQSKSWATGRRDVVDYAERGYLTDKGVSSGSKTLEYAYNDYCIAVLAQGLGDQATADRYFKRAQFSFNLFNPEYKAFWTRSTNGAWSPGFSLEFKGQPIWRGPFYEGSPREYGFYVPHDMAGLITRHGGAAPFLALLDETFDKGLFHLDNEPVFLVPYAYNYAGRPDRSAERVRELLATSYRLAPAWPGQDDSGAMSSWYVFSALGFFPVAGQDVYLIGSPIFPRATLRLGNSGNTFIVRAEKTSAVNKYIQSATLNGKPWNQAWFRHSDIAKGGELALEMGAKPSAWGTHALPPSVSSKVVSGF
ncbi:MAG: GH92 family glycosyl hydrolase [Verrucomicrobiota bacterium]